MNDQMNLILLRYFSYKGVSNLTKLEFIALNTLSLGLYSVYWAWAAWETVRLKEKRVYRVRSSLRAVVLPLSSFWLFPRISKISKYNFWPYFVAMIYLLFICAGFWTPTDPIRDFMGLITYIVTGVIEAILLLPAFEAQRRASNSVKSTENNKPLAWVLFALFVFIIPPLFIEA